MDRKKLVNQSIDFIMQHLEEDLSLDTVAAHFYISKYYFSRIFKEETKESFYAFIKRCKVDQSAIDMKLNPTKAITDIGLDYGYSPSNYSSVFRKHHNTSPSMFKQSIPAHCMPVPFTPERVVCFKTAEEYAAQTEIYCNNRNLALQYAFDFPLLQRNGVEIKMPAFQVAGEDVSMEEAVSIKIQSQYAIPLKISSVLRMKLGISQGELEALLVNNRIQSNTGQDLKKCKLSSPGIIITIA